jgi:hypothetical protein
MSENKDDRPKGSYAIQRIREDLQSSACIAHSCYVWPADVKRQGQLTQGPCHCLRSEQLARYTVTLLRFWIAELQGNNKEGGER